MSKDYAAITSIAELRKVAQKMVDDGLPIGFDLETGYVGPDAKKRAVDHFHKDQFVVGFSFTNSTQWARYVPLRHDSGGNIDDPDGAWEAVRGMLTKSHIVAHNAIFETLAVRKAAGIRLAEEGTLTDTMLASYVLNKYCHSNYRTVVGLKDLVEIDQGHKMMHIHELWPDLPASKEPYIRFNTLEVTPEVVAYACEDALWVLELRKSIAVPAQQEWGFMYTLEHQIMKVMADLTWHGTIVDWESLEKAYAQSQIFAPRMEQNVKVSLGEMAGRDLTELNLNSAVQIKKLLFDELGLSTTRLTKKGEEDASLEDWQRMSSGKDALVSLANDFPAIKTLLEYREVQTLTRRLKKWLKEYNVYEDNRVHANYNQVQVPTGRFSASNPEIQQIQKKWKWVIDPDGSENGLDFWVGNYRDFIVAAEDSYLLTFDFSQAEYRILGGISKEPSIIEGYNNGVDAHTSAAALMFGMPVSEITPDIRQRAKSINFAVVYGQGTKALAETLGVSFDEAKELYAKYFEKLPRVQSWVAQVKKEGIAQGYVRSIFGRKQPVWELKSDRPGIVAKGERVIVNGSVQGASADYVKCVMVKCYAKLKELGWWENGCTMIMNQHDSLSFEVSNSLDPNEVRRILQPCVVFQPKVMAGYPPMVADWEIGQKWGSSKSWPLDTEAVFQDGHWTVYEPDILESIFRLEAPPSKDVWAEAVDLMQKNHGTTVVTLDVAGKALTTKFAVNMNPGLRSKLDAKLKPLSVDYRYAENN